LGLPTHDDETLREKMSNHGPRHTAEKAGGTFVDDGLRGFYEAEGLRPIPKELKRVDLWRASLLMRMAKVSRDERVLDVGAGAGWAYSGRAAPGRVVALDLAMTRLATIRCNCDDVPCAQGNAESLPFRPRSADVVICSEVLEHLLSPQKAVEEIARTLRRGGRTIISVPNNEEIVEAVCLHCHRRFPVHGHLSRFSAGRLREMLASCGLKPKCVSVIGTRAVTAALRIFPSCPHRLLAVFDFLGRAVGMRGRWVVVGSEKTVE